MSAVSYLQRPIGVMCALASALIVPVVLHAQAMPLAIVKPSQSSADPKVKGTKASDGPVVLVYIDGSIKGTDKKSNETSTTNGSLAMSFADVNWDATISMNVAASQDSITTGFGQSLLVPGNGGFASGLIDVRRSLSAFKAPSLYVRGYLSSSSHRWSIKDEAGTPTTAVANALGSGVGLSWQLFSGTLKRPVAKTSTETEKKNADGEKDETPKTEDVLVSARLDFSAMRRALHGPVTERRFDTFRNTLLNGGDNVFHGFEIGLLLQYGTIRGSLAYYSFPNASDVDGLTRGQIAAGFAIAAPILSGHLER
jgi:hypothetical protein